MITVWEVVALGGVHVRSAKDLASPALGSGKNPGDVVRGVHEGSWVALIDEPGFILISGGGMPLLRMVPGGLAVWDAQAAAGMAQSSATAAHARPSGGDEDEDGGPGVYVVMHDNAGVRSGLPLTSPVISRLHAGQTVRVLEVQHSPMDSRVRGRIKDPGGWMSLLEPTSGYRWAKRAAPLEPDEAAEAEAAARRREAEDEIPWLRDEIRERDLELETLRARSDQFRVEYQAHLNDFQERIEDLEARLLSGSMVPVGDDELPPSGWAPRPSSPEAPLMRLEFVAAARDAALARARKLGVPEGGRVLDVRRIDLAGPLTAALAAEQALKTPKPVAKVPPDLEPELQRSGRLVASEAVFLPSPLHAPAAPAERVFPVTWPPAVAVRHNFLDRWHEPLPQKGVYVGSDTGAWRVTEARACPLVLRKVEMVRDRLVDPNGQDDLHINPCPVWYRTS